MEGQNLFWSYWYFHLPNYALSALFYTLFGRFLLGLFVGPQSPNYIYRWFCRLTDWFVGPVAVITPRALPLVLLPPVAAFWALALRVALFGGLFALGLTPPPPGTAG